MSLQTLFGRVDDMAMERLRMLEPPEGYYVAFSCGKDSIVTLDICERAGVKFDAHYNYDVPPPELVYFFRKHYAHKVEIHYPKARMFDLIPSKGLPTRMSRWCCSILKEGEGINREAGRIVVTGVRAAESPRRAKRGAVEICRRDPRKRYVHAIFEWSDEQVWEYIRERNLPYPSLYDEGFRRLGCVMCPMTNETQKRKEMARWPKIAEAYKRAAFRSWHAKKAAGKLEDTRKWPTPEAMWEWWISDAQRAEGADQGRFCFADDDE